MRKQFTKTYINVVITMSSQSKLINQDVYLCNDNGSSVSYFLFYYQSARIRKVSKKVFNVTVGPVFDKHNKKVRVIDCKSRSKAYNKIKGFLSRDFITEDLIYECQSLFSDAEDVYTGAKLLLKVVKMLGSIQSKVDKIGKSILISLIKLFMEIYSLVTNGFDFTNFCQIILSIYQMHETFFMAQSLDVFLIAGISAFLPEKLIKILRSAQLLTQMKVGDDMSLLNKLVAAIFNLCDFLMDKLPANMPCKDLVVWVFSFFKNNTAHVWIMQMDNILKEVEKTPAKLNNESFRTQIEFLNKKLVNNPEILDWSRRSAALASTINRWRNLMRVVISYGNPDRQEPNCFVFEGPPGCMKSCVMNAVISASGQTCYSHMVKATSDGKDWYDSYNNEQIFFMDDVGQQGISQWRTIINMVSSVKMPLDCAEASLKDTKFFNSSTIMVTTNMFQNLQGITKQDCISDVKALWRRGYVFDFGKVTRKGDFIEGLVQFTYFDINTNKFELDFPPDFRKKYPLIKSFFSVKSSEDKLKLIAWILSIVNGFCNLKKSFTDNNKLNKDDIELIRKMSDDLMNGATFEAQVGEAKALPAKDMSSRFFGLDRQIFAEKFYMRKPARGGEVPSVEDRTTMLNKDYDRVNSYDSYIPTEIPKLDKTEKVKKTWSSWLFGDYSGIDEDSRPNGSRYIRDPNNINIYENSFPTETVDEDIDLQARAVVPYDLDENEGYVEPTWCDLLAMGFYKTKYFIQILSYSARYYIRKILEDPELSGQIAAVVVGLLVFGIEMLLIYLIKRVLFPKNKNGDEIKSQTGSIFPDKKFEFESQSWRSDFKYPDSSLSSSTLFVQKAVKEIDIIYDGRRTQGFGVVSGRHVLVPKHFIERVGGVLVIYQDRDKNHILVDNETFVVEWSLDSEDIAVLALPKSFPSPFPNLSKLFEFRSESGLNCLVNAHGIKYINDTASRLNKDYTYVHKLNNNTFVNKIGPKDYTYDVQGLGLCGSIVFNQNGGILGMHVAGDPVANTGVAMKWCDMVRQKIKIILESDKNILPWSVSDKKLTDTSVIKLDRQMFGSVPTATNFGPSPLYGIYPVTREPAKLQVFGRCTVKDIAKKSFKPVAYVPEEEIEFGRLVVRSILKPFDIITEREIVKGNDLLAGLNKKSSNGYACDKLKETYIDFEAGELTPRCRQEIEEIEESIRNGDPKWDAFVWVESLKDELRNEEKMGVPRSFRVGTIHQQILMKKYFGEMVAHIINTRDFNQIMVGMNPYLEWPGMYDKLKKSIGVFAGDVKNWDGNMVSQVQRAATEEIVNMFKGDKEMVRFLLETLVHSLVAIQDDFYLTTHSMPSGSFLTAIFNSLVNKFYTAMWFYRECKRNGVTPTVKNFWEIVIDYVYGDDKTNGVNKYPEFLNALTMRDFFRSVGMNLTTASKGEIMEPFEHMDDISFLKRTFRYHNILNRVVCPLELRTLFSGLSFVDVSKDLDVVMDGKVGCFQREIYLHPDREMLLMDFKNRLKNFPLFKCKIFTESYLYSVYTDPECVLDNFADLYV